MVENADDPTPTPEKQNLMPTDTGPASLAATASKVFLESLRKRVKQESKDAAFAIGGFIPVVLTADTRSTTPSQLEHSPPATSNVISDDVPGTFASLNIQDDAESSLSEELSNSINNKPPVGDDHDLADNHNSHDDIVISAGDANPSYAGSQCDFIDGGNSIASNQPASVAPYETQHSAPVVIRWDGRDDQEGVSSRLTLPIDINKRPHLAKLVQDCSAASFGRGSQDVYDENYRKAGKLDETEFSTNFDPHALGIIDTISRILLPTITRDNLLRGVRAELYKLNVYSSPSGKFKPHVDTPRATSHFGSLVVCLPNVHEGGQLAVRHADDEVVFDWSGDEAAKGISWAAFYSDCEHEVLEVTSGHRLTLTYNLYVSSTALAEELSPFDPKTLAIYNSIRDALAQPAFMRKGGKLGIYCSHAYAHTADLMIKHLPENLKGIDMIMYQAFKTAGLSVELRPVADNEPRNEDENYVNPPIDSARHQWSDVKWGPIEEWIEEDRDPMTKIKGDGSYDAKKREKILLGYRFNMENYNKFHAMRKNDIVSTSLRPLITTETGAWEDANWIEIYDDWRTGADGYDILEIEWLNKPQHKEAALIHLTYGNEPGMGTIYSAAALIVDVPSFFERQLK